MAAACRAACVAVDARRQRCRELYRTCLFLSAALACPRSETARPPAAAAAAASRDGDGDGPSVFPSSPSPQ